MIHRALLRACIIRWISHCGFLNRRFNGSSTGKWDRAKNVTRIERVYNGVQCSICKAFKRSLMFRDVAEILICELISQLPADHMKNTFSRFSFESSAESIDFSYSKFSNYMLRFFWTILQNDNSVCKNKIILLCITQLCRELQKHSCGIAGNNSACPSFARANRLIFSRSCIGIISRQTVASPRHKIDTRTMTIRSCMYMRTAAVPWYVRSFEMLAPVLFSLSLTHFRIH